MTARMIESLRDRTSLSRAKENPPPPLLTPEQEAAVAWHEMCYEMERRADSGSYYLRYDRYVPRENAQCVQETLSRYMQDEGFSCATVRLYYDPDDDDISEMAHLVVQASWLSSGFCLLCGKEHHP